MKQMALACIVFVGLVAGAIPALAQGNALTNLSSTYGNWVGISNTTVASGSATISPVLCYVNVGAQGGGRSFFPYATNAPVTIVDGANTETVTPSAVSSPAAAAPSSIGPYACSFTATFSNAHNSGVTLISGDGGRAEAANDNGNGYPLTNGMQTLAGSCTGTATSSTTIFLYGLGGAGSAQTCTLAAVSGNPPVMQRAGVLKGLTMTATHVGVSSSSGVVTVLKNGSSTTLTCTFGTAAACADATHTVAFVAGDVITVSVTTQATEVLAGLVGTIEAF